MTTIPRIFAGVSAGALLFSCASSLDKSPLDRVLRLEGSYTCDRHSRESAGEKETLAQADASRVRCAQDSWSVFGNEVRFTRTLYQSRDCRTPLGKIVYTAPFERLPGGIAVRGGTCQSIRTSAGWVGENDGKCLYHRQTLNLPYPLQKGCHAYIPDLCKSEQTRLELTAPEAELSDDHREAVSQLSIRDPSTGSPQVCKRYAAE
jgi:hypothetical protein